MTIASDAVDPESVERPPRWDVRSIQRFMLVFGLVSSAFDLLTFMLLRFALRLSPDGFRTGWFVESLLTELIILFVVRTHRPVWRSRPSRPLVWTTLLTAAFALACPYLPLREVFDFVPLPLPVMLSLVGLTLAYAAASEFAKRIFFRREIRASTARAARLSRLVGH